MRVLKLTQRSLTLLFAVAIFTPVSIGGVMGQEKPVNLPARFAHLRHGINLSHWFSQAADYSKTHLDTHTIANDIALIKSLGFDQVRFHTGKIYRVYWRRRAQSYDHRERPNTRPTCRLEVELEGVRQMS